MKNEIKKCEPDGLMYTSNPPQLKCKNCGQFWFTKDNTPNCRNVVLPRDFYSSDKVHQPHCRAPQGFVCSCVHHETEEVDLVQEGWDVPQELNLGSRIQTARFYQRSYQENWGNRGYWESCTRGTNGEVYKDLSWTTIRTLEVHNNKKEIALLVHLQELLTSQTQALINEIEGEKKTNTAMLTEREQQINLGFNAGLTRAVEIIRSKQ